MERKKRFQKYPKKPNNAEQRQVDALDRLAAFEHFEQSVAPQLRDDLQAGLTAAQIYAKYEKLAAARAITIAATEVDASKALAAIKDVLDRIQGKAVERKETTHRLGGLSDQELNAYLATKISESGTSLRLTDGDDDDVIETDPESESTE